MKLDERFKVLPFCCFGTDKKAITNHIGEKGYFSNRISSFKDINLCKYGTLGVVLGNQQDSFCMYETGATFDFFIPECFVKPKEKQYRPFTIDEFFEKFHLGDGIYLRPKNHRSLEFNVVYNGYAVDTGSNEIKLYLGSGTYTLSELFQSYERFYIGRWYPFGVEVEE